MRPVLARRTRSPDDRPDLWAKRGTRPPSRKAVGPAGPAHRLTYIFGAICPKNGKAAGLIQPLCNTQAMNLHLAEISGMVASTCHALLLLDQAGWHLSHHLIVPENVTLLPLPPKCPVPCVAKNSPPHCCLNAPYRSRTSGSSCATTGCQTASSPTTTTSSINAATLGTASRTVRRASLPSGCAIGSMGCDQ